MHTVIKRRTGLANLNLRELWEYRELLGFLAWRDVVVRYKQTYIGAGWAFLRPFLTMVIFTVVFGKIAKLPSDGVPYPILTYTALLPWQFFATAFPETGNSVVGNAYMIDPKLPGGPPTMFICGNDEGARAAVTAILDRFGWETADMGLAEAARAIEPLCILWCLPGFTKGQWTHAFKLLKA